MSNELPVALVVRAATDDEFERVGELVVGAYREAGHLEKEHGYDVVLRDVRARARWGPVLVATPADDQTTILGSATICPSGTPYAEIARADETEIRFVAVAPTSVRLGIARTLVNACIDHARDAGHHAVVLSVIDWNDPGHRLYEAMGFTRVFERDWNPVPDVSLNVFELVL